MSKVQASATRGRRSSFRRRPVSFGNPSLEAYQGTVYTTSIPEEPVVIEGALAIPFDESWVALTDVPPEQVPEGVLHLVRAHRPWIRHLRIVVADNNCSKPEVASKDFTMAKTTASLLAASEESEGGTERTYLVLLQVTSAEAAEQLVEDLDGQPFTSLDETQVGYFEHIIAWAGPESLHAPLFATKHSPRGELVSHNCAVCLESMDDDGEDDEEAKTIVTTVCNHTFHLDCLAQCQGSPCPVCRYDHSGLNNESLFSQCHICGTTEHNYVCLICGTISCGGRPAAPVNAATVAGGIDRPAVSVPTPASSGEGGAGPQSHARQHYNDTLHAYALEAETQHVWDFCGQGYVHRLLQNKDDGKLVEIPDPSNTSSHERSLQPGLSSTQEEAVVHRKLEGLASAYYSLLKSQLQAQRVYYEERLTELRRDESKRRSRLVRDWVAALKQERHQLSQRLVLLESRENKAREDVAFLKSMNESLETNKEAWQTRMRQAQEERTSVRKMFEDCLPPLQEKVTRLMLQLEAEK
jgi:BRCA1-associated protein